MRRRSSLTAPTSRRHSGRLAHRRVVPAVVLARVAAAAALLAAVACNGDDDGDGPDAGTLAADTLERGGAGYVVAVRQGNIDTIAEVALDGTGPSAAGETDFDDRVRAIELPGADRISAVVDTQFLFARPGGASTDWGAAAIDDEMVGELGLSQLIALHDPGSLLRLTASSTDQTGQDDGSGVAGSVRRVTLSADGLDDPLTAALALRAGLATIELHLWPDDADEAVQRLAMPLRLGTATDPADEAGAGEPAAGGAGADDVAAGPIPQLWVVVDLTGFGDLDEIELERPGEIDGAEIAARLAFEPFTGLADMVDPRGVPEGPFVEPGDSPGARD